MPDYSKSVVYCIYLNNKPIYIGSTTNLQVRKRTHKKNYLNDRQKHYYYPVYVYIRENGGWENVGIKKIDDYPCNSKNELTIKEGEYIREYIQGGNNIQNKVIPGRTHKEYHQMYYNKNKDKILKKNKRYNEENKEWYDNYKKEYYEKNKERINNRNNNNYQKNRKRILARQAKIAKQRIKCKICDVEMNRGSLLSLIHI